jgi:hypothetical protein
MSEPGKEPKPRSPEQARPEPAAGGAVAPSIPPGDPRLVKDSFGYGGANEARGELRLPGSAMPADVAVPVARIYRPAPSPMQSAPFGTRDWILEFAPGSLVDIEPLMGWTSGQDPFASIARLRFPDLESAIAFAERQGWRYLVREPPIRRFKPKSYADNFRYDLASALARAQQPWDGGMSIAGGWPADQAGAGRLAGTSPPGP